LPDRLAIGAYQGSTPNPAVFISPYRVLLLTAVEKNTRFPCPVLKARSSRSIDFIKSKACALGSKSAIGDFDPSSAALHVALIQQRPGTAGGNEQRHSRTA
jgi:hypothetical protein